ncbi:MAG TPA: serine hydrolase domain-containing protein [Solirubrobacterales bacterium]|nr:serine hydrolase domain-containing protein [Solirubrobacterales bacterium]
MVNRGRVRIDKAGLILLAALSALVVIALPQSAPASTNSDLNRALDRIMEVPNGPPGISMQIVRDGKSQYYRRGLANVESGQKPQLRQRFRIASVAKAFSGAVALNLVARGELRLQSTIGEVLPGLMPKAKQVTLAQALHHTGGLPEYIKSKGFINQMTHRPKAYVSPRKVISWVRGSNLTHRPGTRYEYSDTDNIVVGLMAEKVTGTPYLRQIRQLGRQIGGLRSTFMPRTVKLPGPYMRGYEIEPGQRPGNISNLINPSGAWASGGIVSTLPDLGDFFRAYVSGRFFGQGENKARVIEAQRRWRRGESQPAGPGTNWAGLGLFRYVSKCGTVFGHTGSFPGYRVFAASSANGKRSVAFVANAQILKGTQGNPNAPRISALIRRMQVAAVCHALG